MTQLQMKTKKTLVSAALILVLAATSCNDPNPVAKLYAESAETAGQPARWAGTQPVLNNAADSASYLMGYVYGGNMRAMLQNGRLPDIEKLNSKDVEQGFAIALEADSTTLGTLYGIMLGLELRSSMEQLNKGTGLVWKNKLVYKGFYQGLNSTVPSALPIPMAEEQLNRLLRPYFVPDEKPKMPAE